MMQVMKDIGGVEMPETLAKLTGVEGQPAAAASEETPAPQPTTAPAPVAE